MRVIFYPDDWLDKFYDKLKEVHKGNVPNWRFGELISNFSQWLYAEKGMNIFFPEEDKMLELLEEYCKKMEFTKIRFELRNREGE